MICTDVKHHGFTIGQSGQHPYRTIQGRSDREKGPAKLIDMAGVNRGRFPVPSIQYNSSRLELFWPVDDREEII